MERAITDEKVTGTGTVATSSQRLGGVLITTDGTNAAVVCLRKNTAKGDIIFDVSTKTPLWVACNIEAAAKIYYSISGTGGYAQIFEFVTF